MTITDEQLAQWEEMISDGVVHDWMPRAMRLLIEDERRLRRGLVEIASAQRHPSFSYAQHLLDGGSPEASVFEYED